MTALRDNKEPVGQVDGAFRAGCFTAAHFIPVGYYYKGKIAHVSHSTRL